MPRISGRSSCTTESLIRFRPRDRSVCRWLGLVPIADRIWVTFSCAISGPLTRTRPEHGGRGDVLERQTAAGRDLLGADEVLQRLHGRVHDVDRVRGPQALGEHVVDARALEDGAHRATGDDTGTGAGRLEQDDTGRGLALHRVRDGAGDAGHPVEVLLGLLDALGDRRGHLLGLAVADTHGAVAVADDDQRGEAEAPTALDDLRHAVDGDDALDEVALLGGGASPAPPPGPTGAAGVSPPRARRHDGRGGRYRRRRRRRVAVVLASDVPLDPLRNTHQKSSPPSRAPSARAAMRPAYRLPPRSNTTAVIPAALARSATSVPTWRARADLSPSAPRRLASRVDALAKVRPAVSSTTWTWMCRELRLTTRRGRSGVPPTRLRRRLCRRSRETRRAVLMSVPTGLCTRAPFSVLAACAITCPSSRPCA